MVARYAVPLLVVVQQVYGPTCDNFLIFRDNWVSAFSCFDQAVRMFSARGLNSQTGAYDKRQ